MKRRLALVVAAAMTISMMGCATSNQKPAETTTAAQTQEAKEEPEETTLPETAGESEGTQAEAGGTDQGYGVQPRSIKDRTLKVGLIPVTMNTAYTMTINGAKKQIEDKGLDIELLVQAPASNTSTITEQGNIMESMIQQGVDAIALATESDNSMLPYLRAAAEADIPVFLFNMTELDKENIYYVSSIGYDQYNAGLEIGKYVAEHYGDKDVKLAILEGYAGIVNTMRIDGFKKGIEGKDNIQIVASQTADWTREKGQSVTESILTSNPDINLIFGDYDEMVLGGLVSIKERGLLDQIDTIGYGCTQDGVSAIENGEMTATIDVGEYGTGIDIIDAVNDFCIEGKAVDKVINRPSKVYDKNNINELDRVIFE